MDVLVFCAVQTPAGHCEQVAAPAEDENEPAEQAEQPAALSVLGLDTVP